MILKCFSLVLSLAFITGCQSQHSTIGHGLIIAPGQEASTTFYAVYWIGNDNDAVTAVVWREHTGQHTSPMKASGGYTEVHGHHVRVDTGVKAVYALQPDYTLRKILLTENELAQILEMFSTSSVQEGSLADREQLTTWQTQVYPHLYTLTQPDTL